MEGKTMLHLAIGFALCRMWEARAAGKCLPGGWRRAFEVNAITTPIVKLAGCGCDDKPATAPAAAPPAAPVMTGDPIPRTWVDDDQGDCKEC